MSAPPRRPPAAALELAVPDPAEGVKLIRVEGELRAQDADRLSGLLALAVAERARSLIVDLRACRFVDGVCARALAKASSQVGEGLESGVRLVTSPGSALADAMLAAWGCELSVHPTLSSAIRSVDGVSPAAAAGPQGGRFTAGRSRVSRPRDPGRGPPRSS